MKNISAKFSRIFNRNITFLFTQNTNKSDRSRQSDCIKRIGIRKLFVFFFLLFAQKHVIPHMSDWIAWLGKKKSLFCVKNSIDILLAYQLNYSPDGQNQSAERQFRATNLHFELIFGKCLTMWRIQQKKNGLKLLITRLNVLLSTAVL